MLDSESRIQEAIAQFRERGKSEGESAAQAPTIGHDH